MKEDEIMEIEVEPEPEESEAPKVEAEKMPRDSKHSTDKEEKISGEKVDEGGDVEMGMEVEVEGEKVETLGAERGRETTFHTVLSDIETAASNKDMLSMEDHEALRTQLENQLASWSQVGFFFFTVLS